MVREEACKSQELTWTQSDQIGETPGSKRCAEVLITSATQRPLNHLHYTFYCQHHVADEALCCSICFNKFPGDFFFRTGQTKADGNFGENSKLW